MLEKIIRALNVILFSIVGAVLLLLAFALLTAAVSGVVGPRLHPP